MDDFVCKILNDWDLSEWIETFREQGVDRKCLYSLDDKAVEELIPKVGPRAHFRKNLRLFKIEQEQKNTTVQTEVQPSTSDGDTKKGKRKLDLEEFNKIQPKAKRFCRRTSSLQELKIQSDVKNVMTHVLAKLHYQENTKLNSFLRNKIKDLETDKREMVGVFGKSGAGKTSLINALIEERKLLPSGDVHACTSVMIKVEANMCNTKYEAHIEFITKEEWEDELWSVSSSDVAEKLSALYGEEWKQKSSDQLMDPKYFREIPEFLQSIEKILSCETAKELSAKMIKYTRTELNHEGEKGINRWYWPLVKCVTVKVPKIDLLQYVTLVDLPGNGDRNKSRDQMWKEIVGKCSTVWIVADITRPAAEKESWQILKSTASLIGNGGECQNIHFICTKSDVFEDFQHHSAEGRLTLILNRNTKTKAAIKAEFKKLDNVQKHFSEDNFEVFTVSSREFLVGELKEHSEIPKLQKVLQDLNDCHSETLNYISGAYGILSLIQGNSLRGTVGETENVYGELEKNKNSQLKLIKTSLDETYSVFEKCLSDGVEKSKSSCEKTLKTFLYPPRSHGKKCVFWPTLKCVVQNGGIHKPKKKKEINLNMMLTSPLTNSIDVEFRNTFPTKGKNGPFNGVISKFSLDTEKLKKKFCGVDLQLTFLKTEEEKIQSELNKVICDRKKMIYSSLTKTIEDSMQECYQKAASFEKTKALQNMRDALKTHVKNSKDTMFEKAKVVMLTELKSLEDDILEKVKSTIEECLELSFRTDDHSIPDVSAELEMVEKAYDELKNNTKDKML